MQHSAIAKRLIFHVGGYDFLTPEAAHHRFGRELRRFERTWSAAATLQEPVVGEDVAAWQVTASGPNWRVDAELRWVRWDDVVHAADRRPVWRRLPLGFLAAADFILGGALWGYLRASWRYAVFFLYPFVLVALLALLAGWAGRLVAGASGSGLLGAAAGVAAFLLLLRWPARRLYALHLFDDWIFSRDYIRRGDPVLEARLERVAGEVAAAARGGQADEVLVIGHSLGAVLAADLVDRALRLDPGLGREGAPVALVTVGSSIPKIGLHRGASRFRAALRRLASAPGLLWAEYQALSDVMNFYKKNPMAVLGMAEAGGPIVRPVRISRMLDPDYYRRIRADFFRLHLQFVSANDRRAAYDYFMLVCGPVPVADQVRSTEGAVPLLGPDGALLATGRLEEAGEPPARATPR